MDKSEAIQRFKLAVVPFIATWRGIEAKWVATKSTPSSLLAFHGLMATGEAQEGQDRLADSETVEARLETLPASSLPDLLDDLSRGTIRLGGADRYLNAFGDFDVVRDFSGSGFSFALEQPNVWLRGYGRKEVIDETAINRDLARIGFQGLFEATKDALGFFVGGDTSPHLYLVAPIYVVTNCSLTGDRLDIDVKLHSAVPEGNVEVAFRVGPTGVRRRHRFAASDVAGQAGDFKRLALSIPAPGGKEARVWTFYSGLDEPVQQRWVQRESATEPQTANPPPKLSGGEARRRILRYLLEQERRSGGIPNLQEIAEALGMVPNDVDDQIDILDSQGAIKGNRTFTDAAPMITGRGKALLEDLENMASFSTPPPTVSQYEWDVFISHASEDKETFVRNLARTLIQRGVEVWYDELTLSVGDSLRRSIDKGLAKSRYGIVVISPRFFAKEWPQKELDGLVTRERDGEKVILPVWLDVEALDVARYSPTLADRVAAKAKDGMDKVISDLLTALRAA